MRQLLLSLPFLLFAQSDPQVPISANQNSILQWDAPTLNADGSQLMDLSGYVVALSAPGVDLNQGTAPLSQIDVPEPQVTEQAIAPLIGTQADGIYQLWVRAYDDAGNLSAWSVPLLIRTDSIVPATPTGLRIKITVIVEVQ